MKEERGGHAHFSQRVVAEIGAIPDKEIHRKVTDISIKEDITVEQS